MDFIQKITQYYHTESRHGFTGAAFGVLLIIVGLLFWRFSKPLSLLKGLSLPLLVIGLVMGMGGFGDGYVTQKALPQKLRLYRENKQAFFKEEVPKVERTHHSWLRIRIVWSVLAFAGALLLFTVKKSYWIGVGLGALLMGIIGNVEEAISMRFNERYYQEVLQAAKPQMITQIQKTEPRALILIQVQPLANKQNVTVKTGQNEQPKIERDTLMHLQSPLVRDIIALSRSFERSTEVLDINVITDHAKEFDEGEATKPGKKKKLLDYYRSDLIRANNVSAKHCWLGKKYLD
ncbi:hypothetical protein [Mucilaginibacter sp. 22184]|uniref:hypothetical protein n=1 Tax=Mucilaginibacter sp. 22184 TaxID=3453887 RepID=UPI003F8530EC